jgi:hypothetical protein
MPVKMKDRLSGNFAVVRENVETLKPKGFHQSAGNPLRHLHDAA